MLKIINCEQGTPEWKAARAGRVTASRIKDIMAKGKGGAESASRADYRFQLVCERLSGEPQDDESRCPHCGSTDWGDNDEPIKARATRRWSVKSTQLRSAA